MLLTCSGCQRRVNAPDDAVGKAIRCPLCQHIFSVQAAAVVVAPPAEKPPAPRVFDQESDFGELDSPQIESPRGEFLFESSQPRQLSAYRLRPAGSRLVNAGMVIPALIVLETIIGVFNLPSGIPVQAMGHVLAVALLIITLQIAIAAPFLIFMFIGGVFLRRAHFRGLVLTGAILSIVLAAICLGRSALICIAIFFGRGGAASEARVLLPPLLFSLFAAFLTCHAGIRTIVFISREDVRDAFDVATR